MKKRTVKMQNATKSVQFTEDDQSVREPPKLVSLSNGAMRQGAYGAAEFGHAWQDTKRKALGYALPTPNPHQALASIKGHELKPYVDSIPQLPSDVQVLLHLRHEKQFPYDIMEVTTSQKFIRVLKALDFVLDITPRKYTPIEIATQLSAADQMIGLGALKTPEQKRLQYQVFCTPTGRRCKLAKSIHHSLFKNIELAYKALAYEALWSLLPLPELNQTPEEVFARLQPVRELYTADRVSQEYQTKAKAATAEPLQERERSTAAET